MLNSKADKLILPHYFLVHNTKKKMDSLDINSKFKLITTNINSIPNYDGDRDALLNFLERIDSMVPILESFPLDFKALLMGNIKDKIIGNARRSLLINGNADTWPFIKQILIDNHGERFSVDELIDNIRSCRCDSTIENFYNQLNTLLCRLNNALYFCANRFPEVNSESNARIALNSFKHGLPEPVKSIIVSRNPKSLKEAYDIIKTNGYLKYNNSRLNFFNNSQIHRSNRFNIQQSENNINIRSQVQQNQQCDNNNRPRCAQKYGSQSNNIGQSNFPAQPTQTYHSSQTRRSQSYYPRLSNNPASHVLHRNTNGNQNWNDNPSNVPPSQPPIETMDIGVNENYENFQFGAHENYPI